MRRMIIVTASLLTVALSVSVAACDDGETTYIPTAPTTLTEPVATPSGRSCAVERRTYTWFTDGGVPEWDILFTNTCSFEINIHTKAVAFDRATNRRRGFSEVKSDYQAEETAWICEDKNPGRGNDNSCQFVDGESALHSSAPVDVDFAWSACNPERFRDCEEPPEPERIPPTESDDCLKETDNWGPEWFRSNVTGGPDYWRVFDVRFRSNCPAEEIQGRWVLMTSSLYDPSGRQVPQKSIWNTHWSLFLKPGQEFWMCALSGEPTIDGEALCNDA